MRITIDGTEEGWEVIEKNKKDSSVQIKEGIIYINAKSTVFKPGTFMVYADQQNQDSIFEELKWLFFMLHWLQVF